MLALTAALVGPYFVDWTSYRADFERELGRVLGREVRVEGTATARLLPFPSVTFTQVVVAGAQPGEPAMTVETFSMDAELAPFMRGDFHIFDMRLERPYVLIDVADNGSVDWAVRPSVPIGASHISLEKLTVTEGQVLLRHAASGRIHRLTEINADLSARALTGPWRAEGSLRFDGLLTQLSISTGQVDPQGGMRVRMSVNPQRYPVVLEADGNARIQDGQAHYDGQFRLNNLVAASQPQTPNTAPAHRVSGTFDLSHEKLAIKTFRYETGPSQDPYIAEGSAEFDLGTEPRFSITADGAQIRFDAASDEAVAGFDLNQRISGLREFLLDLPRPTIPGRIDMALPAIVAGDTTIRDVHLSAEPVEGGWSVASLGATLPGRTKLETQGRLQVTEHDIGFTGNLLLAVAQPSGFAAWLAKDVDDAIRRLPAAGFSAQVELGEERQLFRDMELILGASKFNGEIDSRTPAGQKPSMLLKLDGEKLDVDGMTAFASLFVSDDGEARLGGRDLEFQIKAGPVEANSMIAETLDTALRFRSGTLEIDKLSIGGLSGANISAAGSLANLGSQPSGTIDATIIATDLAPFIETLAARFPDSYFANAFAERAAGYPGLLDDTSIHILATRAGQDKGFALSASGRAGGSNLSLTMSGESAEGSIAANALKLDFSARNEDATVLYGLAGLPALPLGFVGGGEMQLSFDGVPNQNGQTRFTFHGEEFDLSFEGQAGLQEDKLSMNGAVTLSSGDIDPWLATSGISLPGFGLGLPVSLSSRVDLNDGLLVLSSLQGEVAETSISGDLNAQLQNALPHLSGALVLGSFDLTTVAELAVGSSSLEADSSIWLDKPFSQTVNAPFSTDLEVSVNELDAGLDESLKDASFVLKINSEGISIADLNAEAFNGRVSGVVDFRNDAGTGLLSAQLRMENAQATDLFGDIGLSGSVDLTAAITASGKSIDGVVSSLTGSGAATIQNISIEAVNPDALEEILQEADSIGPTIDAQAVNRFAPDLIRNGIFSVEKLDVAFTLANGVLRAPPLRLEDANAVLAGEVRGSFRDLTIGADTTLTYNAGTNAVVGAEPAVRFSLSGPLTSPRISTDTDPLAQFLTQRALEREQARVEAMQAILLERQRHRREARYYAAQDEERRLAAEEAARLQEEMRLQAIELQRQQDAEKERLRIEKEQERVRREAENRAEAEQQLRLQVEEFIQSGEAQRVRPVDPDAIERQPLTAPPLSIEGILQRLD